MLQQMADELYPMLTPLEKQVSVNVPDGLTLWGDADKLARVFNNILKNAIAYSYENSVIDISGRQQDKNIVITFTNQGNPIPQKSWKRYLRNSSGWTHPVPPIQAVPDSDLLLPKKS